MSIQIGDTVYINDVNGLRGHPSTGTVTKIGRALVTVSYTGYYPDEKYRLATQIINDKYGRRSFMTEAQELERARKLAASSSLQQHGIRLDWQCRDWSIEKMEAVAEVLRKFEGKEGGEDQLKS
jgi:hypothetical protein